jgi:hypothetical protein
MTWFVDPGLLVLMGQMKAANPGMTIYTIGDANHQSGVSDHNPDADGSVDAADFMIANSFTAADAEKFFQQLIASRDSRIKYVIYNRRIVSRTVSPWTIRAYSGSDPHTNHVHVSVEDTNKSTNRWKVGNRKVSYELLDGSLPVLKYGDADPIDDSGWAHVARLQVLLGVDADGIYGPATLAAIRERRSGSDGTVDISLWKRLIGVRDSELAATE